MSKIEFEKYEKYGKVAVLYSPGFGAGWYSWNDEYDFLLFDKRLVSLVLEGKREEAGVLAEKICGDVWAGGAENLEVVWLNKGDVFEIEEYDGNETIHVIGSREYIVA